MSAPALAPRLTPAPAPCAAPPAAPGWSYDAAFARNRGLVTAAEQERLRTATVAIAGVGGVGGSHALTLARQGVGGFRLIDPDAFDWVNFNRQAGARVDTVGRSKARVVAEMIHGINPDARVEVHEGPLGPDNAAAFVAGADVVLDGVDYFALDARRLLFRAARAAGRWALCAGPIGFSAAFLAFAPAGMSFERYCDLRDDLSEVDRLLAFTVALAPRATQRTYMDLGQVDLSSGAGPSSIIACSLCSAVISMAAVAILLDWEPPSAAPAFLQLDLRRGRLARGRLRWGNRGPLQRLKRALLKRYLVRRGVIPAAAAARSG